MTTVIRLNESNYYESIYENEGIQVKDIKCSLLGNPIENNIIEFIETCKTEIEQGNTVAVHCKDGLALTGTMCAFYLMYKYPDFTAKKAIAWCRLARPGSIVGKQ